MEQRDYAEYKILNEAYGNIERVVQEHLEDGWKLLGAPFYDMVNKQCICQCVVR